MIDIELVELKDRDIGFDRVETYWAVSTWGTLYLAGEVDPNFDLSMPSPRPSYAESEPGSDY
ncbi:hypothetical protein [Halorubrum ruber]|uniref:Uncharacterized protein n=1 Tax=Halorubrum ruber TaxID=2982524 RepID=A0A8T8LQ02_9EURY|nr:hypothetical protein [Halorubrum ruber]QUO48910.1 hypothetical protein J7656_06105 [Halorubrum ruber]